MLGASGKQLPQGIQVAPSLLAADFVRLGEEIRAVEQAGVEIIHLDVMDGHFVPNITFGPPLVASIRGATGLFLDTHLMISNPLDLLDPFARAGADLLTLHAEAICDLAIPEGAGRAQAVLEEATRRLAPHGCRLGLSVRPRTDPVPLLLVAGSQLDLVLIMTVEPGFGGQGFMEELLPRIEQVRRLRDREGWRFRIEVDGGIGARTAGACTGAGAEWLVAGTAVFGQVDRGAAVAEIRSLARRFHE